MSEKESTKIVGIGLIQGKKYTLCWEKGKCFLPTGTLLLDAMPANYYRCNGSYPTLPYEEGKVY